jgi:virulence factor Mce-like protein
MKRVAAITVLLVAVAAVVVLASGAGDSGGYRVRAIFNNAFTVIPGEDVKVAGVKVGSIESLDLTADHKAAVVLRIDRPGFQDFRQDAECTIRPQSLIGERFVECTPTQARAEGEAAAPPLETIRSGPGKGQHLLPASQNSRPIDVDLVNNVLRLPQRQRLTIILNELGAGFAGRGEDLRTLIRNFDPALRETDKVLAILGDQNRVLADLARNSDTVLAPLARERAHVAGFVDKANTTAQATAQRRPAFEASLRKLPGFLEQLQPTMQRLGGLSDQMTPVLTDLGDQAPAINRFVRQLGPFSEAGLPALKTLGEASVPGREALVKSKPIVTDLRDLAQNARPLSGNLRALLESFKDTGGVERALDYIFFQMAAINGFDSVGHYLRAELLLNACSTYAVKPASGCAATFQEASNAGSARAATAASAKGRSPWLVAMDRLLHGASLQSLLTGENGKPGKGRDRANGKSTPTRTTGSPALPPLLSPSPSAPADGGGNGTGASPSPATPASPAPAAPSQSGGQGDGGSNSAKGLLDYLLGGG